MAKLFGSCLLLFDGMFNMSNKNNNKNKKNKRNKHIILPQYLQYMFGLSQIGIGIYSGFNLIYGIKNKSNIKANILSFIMIGTSLHTNLFPSKLSTMHNALKTGIWIILLCTSAKHDNIPSLFVGFCSLFFIKYPNKRFKSHKIYDKRTLSPILENKEKSKIILDQDIRVSSVTSQEFIDLNDLSLFIKNKMCQKNWKKLCGNINSNSSSIDTKQLKTILILCCVLYLVFIHKKNKKAGNPDIDKNKVKLSILPVYDWILRKKLTSNSIEIDEFRTLISEWISEYNKETRKAPQEQESQHV
mmetsp:Transcript_5609/g.6939  ORF Transcript_5609/g.6939 Transcript_5609/m.6939 type:complete len:301 (+) Transcript_5609:85-987(+)